MARKYRKMKMALKAYRAAYDRYSSTGNRFMWSLVEYHRDRYAEAVREYENARQQEVDCG